MAKETISIVVPTYNEAGNVVELVAQLDAVLARAKVKDYEVLFVDDGSSDGTLEVLKQLAKSNKHVGYLSFSRNFGHQAALRAGIANSQGAAIISMDADLQHPPRLLPDMIAKWREGYDIVYTRRHNDDASLKTLTSKWFYRALNRLSGLQIDEGAADFRLIDAKVAQVINRLPEPNLFLRGFIGWAGFSVHAIDYQPDERFSGTSKYSVRKMISLALQGVTQFSIKPLRLASVVGILSAVGGVLYGLYASYLHFTSQATIEGWTSVIVSVLLIGGVQLIVLGIIGEYLGRTFMQTKQRPDYIIKERG